MMDYKILFWRLLCSRVKYILEFLCLQWFPISGVLFFYRGYGLLDGQVISSPASEAAVYK